MFVDDIIWISLFILLVQLLGWHSWVYCNDDVCFTYCFIFGGLPNDTTHTYNVFILNNTVSLSSFISQYDALLFHNM